MPRRNQRDEWHPPLDVTPANQIPPSRTGVGMTAREDRRIRDIARAKAAERQRVARESNAIDWSVCLVPGCGSELVEWGKWAHPLGRRDPEVELPMCYRHAATIWQRAIGLRGKDPEMQEAVADIREILQARADEHDAAAQASYLARTDGDIYFVRLNHLIKVGWTRNLEQRLKSYGASVEVLAYYPGTRDDETTLHRQLRPALARGREWYTDGPIVQRFISDALARYGEPSLKVYWTKPKRDVVAGKRHR